MRCVFLFAAAAVLLLALSAEAQTAATYSNSVAVTTANTQFAYGRDSSANLVDPIVTASPAAGFTAGGNLTVSNLDFDLQALAPPTGATSFLPDGVNVNMLVIYNGGGSVPDAKSIRLEFNASTVVVNSLELTLTATQAIAPGALVPLFHADMGNSANTWTGVPFTIGGTVSAGGTSTTLHFTITDTGSSTVGAGYFILAPRTALLTYASTASGAARTFNRAFGLNQTFLVGPSASDSTNWQIATQFQPNTLASNTVIISQVATPTTGALGGATLLSQTYQVSFGTAGQFTDAAKLLFNIASSSVTVAAADQSRIVWATYDGSVWTQQPSALQPGAQAGTDVVSYSAFNSVNGARVAVFLLPTPSSSSSSSTGASSSSSSAGRSSSSSSTAPASSSVVPSFSTGRPSSSSSSSAPVRPSSSAPTAPSSSAGPSSSAPVPPSAAPSSTGAASSSATVPVIIINPLSSSSTGQDDSLSSSSSGGAVDVTAVLVFNGDQGLSTTNGTAAFTSELINELAFALQIPASQIGVSSISPPSTATVAITGAPSNYVTTLIALANTQGAAQTFPRLAQLYSVNGQLVSPAGVNSAATPVASIGVAAMAAAIVAAFALVQ